MHRQLAALALAGLFVLGVTACSGPVGPTGGPDFGGGGSQTVEEACTSFSAAMASGQEKLGAALREAGSDPAKTAEAFGTLEDSLRDAFSSISNSEVESLGENILDDLTTFSDIVNDVIGNGNTDRTAELEQASNEFTLSMQELQALCA